MMKKILFSAMTALMLTSSTSFSQTLLGSGDHQISIPKALGESTTEPTYDFYAGDGLTLNGRQFSVNSSVIRTTGNQSMSGVKTFTSAPYVNQAIGFIVNSSANWGSVQVKPYGNVSYAGEYAVRDSGSYASIYLRKAGADVFWANSAYDGFLSRDMYAYDYYYNSDERLKKNIEEIPEESARDIVMGLRPVSYDLKNTGEHALGFVAQDVMRTMPYAVSEGDGGYYAVQYFGIISPLTKTVQEMESTVSELEDQIVLLRQLVEEKKKQR